MTISKTTPQSGIDTAAEKAIRLISKSADTAAKSLNISASEAAAKLISAADKAAEEASKRLLASAALAAEAAAKVIAAAAAEGRKVVNETGSPDHDLLIRLSEQILGLTTMMNNIAINTNVDLKDHEARIFLIEKSRGNQTILITVGTGALLFLIGLLATHMLK